LLSNWSTCTAILRRGDSLARRRADLPDAVGRCNLNAAVDPRLESAWFRVMSYQVISWFQSFAYQIQLASLRRATSARSPRAPRRIWGTQTAPLIGRCAALRTYYWTWRSISATWRSGRRRGWRSSNQTRAGDAWRTTRNPSGAWRQGVTDWTDSPKRPLAPHFI
jgi:hypothetical protein